MFHHVSHLTWVGGAMCGFAGCVRLVARMVFMRHLALCVCVCVCVCLPACLSLSVFVFVSVSVFAKFQHDRAREGGLLC